jgi:hypothetical protein
MAAKKTDYLHIRIAPKIKRLLGVRAERLGLTDSEYVRHLIIEDVRRLIDEESEQSEG